MAQMPVHDEETGRMLGNIEIPDEVLEAAELVAEWMRERDVPSLSIHGLKLVVD